MKRILNNKMGITLLEGIIALGLLALAATATFGVLLSVSRKSSSSDIREEMLWAVERAHERLQMYNGLGSTEISTLPAGSQGLCPKDIVDTDPLGVGEHTITCMLPPLCDLQRNSSFTYTVTLEDLYGVQRALYNRDVEVPSDEEPLYQRKHIAFNIQCNGFTLTSGSSGS